MATTATAKSKLLALFDTEYFEYQEMISTLTDSVPKIVLANNIDDKTIVQQLIHQNKAYAIKIMDLFEELSSKEDQLKSDETNKDLDDNETAAISNVKIKHLEDKVEYLNSLVIEGKKTLEKKDIEIKSYESKYDKLMEQIKNLREKEDILEKEKEKLENDMQDILREYSNLKNEYELQIKTLLTNKDNQIQDLNDKINGYEKQIKDLKSIETDQKREYKNSQLKNEDMNQSNKKEDIIGTSINNETPKSRKSTIAIDLSKLNIIAQQFEELLKEINQISLDMKGSLDVQSVGLSGDSYKEQQQPQDDNDINEIWRIRLGYYSDIAMNIKQNLLYTNNLLEKQIKYNNKHQQNIRNSEKKENNLRQSVSKSNKVLKEYQDEINDQLRQSVTKIENNNNNEIYNQLQIQLDKNTELSVKLELMNKFLQKIIKISKEELNRNAIIIESLIQMLSDIPQVNILNALKIDLIDLKQHLIDLYNTHNMSNNGNNNGSNDNNAVSTNKNSQTNSNNNNYKLTIEEEEQANTKKWKDKIQEIFKSKNDELTRLRNEKDMEIKELMNIKVELTYEIDRYKDQIDKMIIEYNNINKQQYNDYEDKLMNLNVIINDLKEKNIICEKTINDREELILEYRNSLNEYEKKYTQIVNDNDVLKNENNTLLYKINNKSNEIEYYKLNIAKSNDIIENINNELTNLKSDRDILDKQNLELKKDIESLRKKYNDDMDKYDLEYNKLKDEYNKCKKINEQKIYDMENNYDILKLEYKKEIDELNNYIEQLRKNHDNLIYKKNDEIKQLQINIETLDQLKLTQEEVLKNKDEKYQTLLRMNKEMENRLHDNDKFINELTLLKDKNKKYFDLLTQSNNDLNILKSEYQKLLHEKSELQLKLRNIEREHIDQRAHMMVIKEEEKKLEDIINNQKDEIKLLRQELETLNDMLKKKDKDIKFINDTSHLQSKATLSYKDEIISRQKEDIKQLTNELENLRREYQQVIENNENMMNEIIDLKKEAEEKDITFNNLVKLNDFNDDLIKKVEKIKKEKLNLEESFSQQKLTYKQELETTKKKLKELERRLSFKDAI